MTGAHLLEVVNAITIVLGLLALYLVFIRKTPPPKP